MCVLNTAGVSFLLCCKSWCWHRKSCGTALEMACHNVTNMEVRQSVIPSPLIEQRRNMRFLLYRGTSSALKIPELPWSHKHWCRNLLHVYRHTTHSPQVWITEQNRAWPLSPVLFGWVFFMVNLGRSKRVLRHFLTKQALPSSSAKKRSNRKGLRVILWVK